MSEKWCFIFNPWWALCTPLRLPTLFPFPCTMPCDGPPVNVRCPFPAELVKNQTISFPLGRRQLGSQGCTCIWMWTLGLARRSTEMSSGPSRLFGWARKLILGASLSAHTSSLYTNSWHRLWFSFYILIFLLVVFSLFFYIKKVSDKVSDIRKVMHALRGFEFRFHSIMPNYWIISTTCFLYIFKLFGEEEIEKIMNPLEERCYQSWYYLILLPI